MQRRIRDAWGGNPPNIRYIAAAAPDTIELPLSGSGTGRLTPQQAIQELEDDFQNHTGEYYAWVFGHYESGDEADCYELQSWDIYYPNPSDGNAYEAVIILSYAPVNHLATLKKHMPEFVDEYLAEQARLEQLEQLLELAE